MYSWTFWLGTRSIFIETFFFLKKTQSLFLKRIFLPFFLMHSFHYVVSCLSNELGSTQQRQRHTPSIIVTDNWCYMLSWQTNLNYLIIYAFIDSITNDLLLYAAINTPILFSSIVNHILFSSPL